MVKFVPNHHGNHVIVSYTKNKGGGGGEAPEMFAEKPYEKVKG